MRRYRPTSAIVPALRRAGDTHEPRWRRFVPVPGSALVRGSVAGVLTGIVLAAAACGADGGNGGDGDEVQLDSETQAACESYTEIVNQWGQDYGIEMGEVGAAEAEGNGEERKEQAVETVRELFLTAAESLRQEADGVSDETLAEELTRAGNGAEEIAGQIETYEDVQAAPGLMEEGEFAAGGEQVQDICAGN